MDNIGKKATTGLFWNYAERILAQLVSLVVSIILARLIAPEHYGAISIVTILITLLNVFISNGFGNALIQSKEAKKSVFNSLFYISFSLSLVLYLIVFFTAPLISSFYGLSILTPVIRVMAIRLPIASLNTIQHAYLVRRLEFKKFFITTFFGTVISAVVGIAMAYMGFEIWALVGQYLTNVTIDTVLLYFTCGWKPGRDVDWDKGKRLLPFGAKILGTALIANLYDEISGLIIGKHFSVTDLAYYTKGKQFPSIIVTNINASISRVLFSAMSKYQDDVDRIKAMLRRSLKINLYVIGPIMIGMMLCAAPIIRVVLTDKWIDSTFYLQAFCITFLLKAVRNTYVQAFNSLGHSGTSLTIQIMSTTISLISLLIAVFCFKKITLIVLSAVLAQLIAVIASSIYSIRILNYSIKERFLDFMPTIVALFFMSIVVILTSRCSFDSQVLKLLLEVLSGASTYVVVSLIMKIDSLKYIINIIKSYIGRRKNV